MVHGQTMNQLGFTRLMSKGKSLVHKYLVRLIGQLDKFKRY